MEEVNITTIKSGGRFPYKKLAKYPHMKPEDVVVWERFITKNPRFFDTVDYDVPVGTGAPQNPEHPENIQRDGTILTQKKIDAIGYINGITTIVEVGPIADMRKFGQIMTYDKLYKADRPEQTPILKMIVCREVEREMEKMFQEFNILIEIA